MLTSTGFAGALTGNVTGNCSGSSGSCTGNAATSDGVDTTSSNNDSTHYLTMVSSSSTEAGSTIRKYSNINCNPNSGTVTATTLADTKGNVRSIPRVAKSSNYTLAASDAGKHIYANNNPTITIPASTFADGDAITIINASTSDMTISRATGVALYMPDGADANCTVGKYGMVTILHSTSDVFWISGSPLSQ